MANSPPPEQPPEPLLIEVPGMQPSDDPDVIGKISTYDLLEVLGQGAMGVVVRAHDRKANQIVALKILRPEFTANPSAISRLRREAETTEALRDHPNVIRTLAVSRRGPPFYIAMEYIDGVVLDDLLAQRGRLPIDEALEIGVGMVNAVEAAHKVGIVHRDLKPANILLEASTGLVKVGDFGLAVNLGDITRLTQEGAVVGTPAYMSPEQAYGQDVGPRSDVFSMGSILYEMLTGRPPFLGESAIAVTHQITHVDPPAVRDLRAAVPESVADLIHAMLAKRPDERPSDLRRVRAVLRGEQYVPPRMPTVPAVEPPPPPRSWVSYGLVAVVVLALSLAAGLFVWQYAMVQWRREVAVATRNDLFEQLLDQSCNQADRGELQQAEDLQELARAMLVHLASDTSAEMALKLDAARQHFKRTKALHLLEDAQTALAEEDFAVVEDLINQIVTLNVSWPDATSGAEQQYDALKQAYNAAVRRNRALTELGRARALITQGSFSVAVQALQRARAEQAVFRPGDDTPEQVAELLNRVRQQGTSDQPSAAVARGRAVTLPTGLRKQPNVRLHASGWPLEVLAEPDLRPMVFVPAGPFQMGSDRGDDDARPAHTVTLSAFYIDKYEVTAEQYCHFLNEEGNRTEGGVLWFNPSADGPIFDDNGYYRPLPGCAQKPVTQVSWYGARTYCRAAGYELPTEAQWEKAARGTDHRDYPWGDIHAGSERCAINRPWRDPVRTLADVDDYPIGASPCGAYQMAGNVWEWCYDWYSEGAYHRRSPTDPTGPRAGDWKVARGGGWNSRWDSTLTFNRYRRDPAAHHANLGFRGVRNLP